MMEPQEWDISGCTSPSREWVRLW